MGERTREMEREEGDGRTDGRRRGHVGPRPPSMRNNDRDRGASEQARGRERQECLRRPPARPPHTFLTCFGQESTSKSCADLKRSHHFTFLSAQDTTHLAMEEEEDKRRTEGASTLGTCRRRRSAHRTTCHSERRPTVSKPHATKSLSAPSRPLIPARKGI